MRILAIDYGKKRVGIAITYDAQIAFVRESLKSDSNLCINILDIAKTEKIDVLLIGFPRMLSGELSDSSNDVLLFKTELENIIKNRRMNLKVKLVDERLSTVMAAKRIQQKGIKLKKEKIDSLSAQVFLEDYLISIASPKE